MFEKRKETIAHADSTTLIAAGTVVTGNLSFAGCIEIEGRVEGDILAADPGHGTVRVLANGVVDGRICAPCVIINGRVNGDVDANGQVELASKAIVTGNVHYRLIEMVKGAQVNGNLVYEAEDSPRAAVRTVEAETGSKAAPGGMVPQPE